MRATFDHLLYTYHDLALVFLPLSIILVIVMLKYYMKIVEKLPILENVFRGAATGNCCLQVQL